MAVHKGSISAAASRRGLLSAGFGMAAAGAARFLPGCATPSAAAARMPAAAGNEALAMLAAQDLLNCGASPDPIPWLDKNSSHNQMQGPGAELSHLFHFKGRIARANDFTGAGTDGSGERLSFGAKSTDFSFQQGEYFAGRQARRGAFGHL